jgi:hypothetical protein
MRQFAVGDSINVPDQSRGVPRRSEALTRLERRLGLAHRFERTRAQRHARQRNRVAYCVIIATANDGLLAQLTDAA